MSAGELGRLKTAEPRSQWPVEARDFTPWLASEEGLAMLGEALGLNLEVVATERPVGPYFADILARETGAAEADSPYVIIENQLGKLNHDHLGKALTYAGGLEARTVVWVATEFSDEHLRAVSWLNDLSAPEYGFFAVRLELWQIDESRPAVKFNVLARPVGLKPREARDLEESAGPLGRTQLRFWRAVTEGLREKAGLELTPRPRHYLDVSLGRTGIFLSNQILFRKSEINVRLFLSSLGGAKEAFRESLLARLLERRKEIEAELGAELTWPDLGGDDLKYKTVDLCRALDLADESALAEGAAWTTEWIIRFRNLFAPLVNQFRS